METPETEQPPSLPEPVTSEEQIDIVIVSPDPESPKIQVSEEESSQIPTVTPLPTPASSSASTPLPTPRSGTNGSAVRDALNRTSMGRQSETTSSPYINGSINNRYSYSGSVMSESMDMSIHRENVSVPSRVSQSEYSFSSMLSYILLFLQVVF